MMAVFSSNHGLYLFTEINIFMLVERFLGKQANCNAIPLSFKRSELRFDVRLKITTETIEYGCVCLIKPNSWPNKVRYVST